MRSECAPSAQSSVGWGTSSDEEIAMSANLIWIITPQHRTRRDPMKYCARGLGLFGAEFEISI